MVTFRKTEALAACFFDFCRDVRSRLIDFEVRREVASSQVTRIVIRSAFLELAADAAVATDATEVVSRPAARTPPSTRAGGQDDGSLNKLPQIKVGPSPLTPHFHRQMLTLRGAFGSGAPAVPDREFQAQGGHHMVGLSM